MSGVLLATHGSPAARHATAVAADIAVARDVELTIVRVLPPVDYRLARMAQPFPLARRLDDPYGDQVLLDARRMAWERGATVGLVLLAGLPAPPIAAWARREQHGLIVIGASVNRWPARFAAPTRHRLARRSPALCSWSSSRDPIALCADVVGAPKRRGPRSPSGTCMPSAGAPEASVLPRRSLPSFRGG